MSLPNPPLHEIQPDQPNLPGAADILVAAATIAALGVAVAVLLPSTSFSNKVTLNISGNQISIVRSGLLFVGLCAIGTCFRAVDALRKVAGLNADFKFLFVSYLGWLWIALLLFAIVYVIVVIFI